MHTCLMANAAVVLLRVAVIANMRGNSPEEVAATLMAQPGLQGLQGPTISPVYGPGEFSASRVQGFAVQGIGSLDMVGLVVAEQSACMLHHSIVACRDGVSRSLAAISTDESSSAWNVSCPYCFVLCVLDMAALPAREHRSTMYVDRLVC